jgi:O-acetyl-ADP-ribose deacetylase (regulator of RNase III)
MTPIAWTHPSVRRATGSRSAEGDPTAWVERKARDVALSALERGWEGPPYDPFELADLLEIETVARQDLDDARLVSVDGKARIEFNPQRGPARIRFSIAHEIGHYLFDDYAERPRYRDISERRPDDWQLEMLCNVAAAEFLMPAGAFPARDARDLSLSHLLDQRARFGVSTEALLRRVVKLTDQPASVFTAARLGVTDGFRLDYVVGSRAWWPHFRSGYVIGADSVLSHCTAVGFADQAHEHWGDDDVIVQAVGVPPYPGDTYPRVVGLLSPAKDVGEPIPTLRYVRGDATEPRHDGPAIIAHVVNDRARSWGGRGFAVSLGARYSAARDAYTQWATKRRQQLGDVHVVEVNERLWIASLVAQAGYGDEPASRPRLRLSALRQSLDQLALSALEREATVHVPLIGTGQGGTPWPRVRDILLEELADRHVETIVYVLPDAVMPEEVDVSDQLTLI